MIQEAPVKIREKELDEGILTKFIELTEGLPRSFSRE